MIRGALFLLICDAGRKLAPVCEFKKSSDDQPWYVYNEEQMSRVDSTAERKVGEYHYTTCFVETEKNPQRMEATTMYAVSTSHLELKKSDICYGWPETESAFTRGPKLSKIEKKITYKYEGSECGIEGHSKPIKEPDEWFSSLPANCSAFLIFHTNPSKPYEGNATKVQSFSGLDTLNFDAPLTRKTEFLKVPGESKLTIYLKKDRRSDCFLLLSAYSPLTNKILPIDYIKFEKEKKEGNYTLNRYLIASLYNMGVFDLQFQNNHLTNPCDDNNIDFIKSRTSLHIFQATKVSEKLRTKVHELQSCPDGGSNSVLIDMSSIKDDIYKFRVMYPDADFELPIKLHLELKSQNLGVEIDKWEVYTTDDNLDSQGCPVSLTKGKDYIILELDSTPNEEGGQNVTAELRLQMAFGKMIPRYFQIRNVSENALIKDFQAFLRFGDMQSERRQGENSMDIIVEEKSIEIEYHTWIKAVKGDILRFLLLSKPKETTRSPIWKSWNTEYSNSDKHIDCGYCNKADRKRKNFETFWDCRSKCETDHTGFKVTRNATFSNSEIPRLSGDYLHSINGHAIDLDLPPCAQNNTNLQYLTVIVGYTDLDSRDECTRALKGTASLNVPEFTRAVYFNEITLDNFADKEIGKVGKTGKSSSYYEFNLTLLAKIGTLPQSIIIGYKYKNAKSCADKIENISVSYQLNYKPPNNTPMSETPPTVTDEKRNDETSGETTKATVSSKPTTDLQTTPTPTESQNEIVPIYKTSYETTTTTVSPTTTVSKEGGVSAKIYMNIFGLPIWILAWWIFLVCI